MLGDKIDKEREREPETEDKNVFLSLHLMVKSC
jgi:hypothetical protein